MDYQKDNKKTNIVNQTSDDTGNSFLDDKALVNKPTEYINKKTEKIVTALYMVTDCMDTDDALKTRIRILGVELLSDMYELSNLLPVEKRDHISFTLSHVKEMLSLIEISYTIGFISEMNSVILKREISALSKELQINLANDKHFTFTLDEKMFDLPSYDGKEFNPNNPIKDFSNRQLDKRTSSTMSFINNRMSVIKGLSKNHSNTMSKEERSTKILSFIKDKKNIPSSLDGFSIKDISTSFDDCSEKTIQRELNSLIVSGKIKKIGAKRWSRYQAL